MATRVMGDARSLSGIPVSRKPSTFVHHAVVNNVRGSVLESLWPAIAGSLHLDPAKSNEMRGGLLVVWHSAYELSCI